MKTVDEAFEALARIRGWHERTHPADEQEAAEKAAARALALAAHVEVCGRYAASDKHGAPPPLGPKCGDGWYCDKAPSGEPPAS